MTTVLARDNGLVSRQGPRAGGPSSRRVFSPAQKLEHLAGYEAAVRAGEGGGYLRREGLYSSQMTEWRKLRDGGVLAGKKPGEKVGRLTAEQAEIARLRRELKTVNSRLVVTGAALGIMGKTQALLDELSRRAADGT